jgi:hypothetical protein
VSVFPSSSITIPVIAAVSPCAKRCWVEKNSRTIILKMILREKDRPGYIAPPSNRTNSIEPKKMYTPLSDEYAIKTKITV